MRSEEKHVNAPTFFEYGRRRGASVLLAVLVFAVALVGALAVPVERAEAMEAVKCTGRPNSEDDPTVIMGATESRITFEASIAEGEGVSSLTLHIPDGTSFSTNDLAVTLLTGDDLMTRNEVDYTESVDGQDLTLEFAEPITQEGHLNILVYEVFFPTDGGEMQLEATYELADGTEKPIEGIPAIPVEGISLTESISQWLEEQAWVQAWNSNRFLHLFFDPSLLVTSFPVVLTGFFMSISIVAVAFPLAIPMGLLLALMRISKLRLLRGIATTYVNIVRGTPLFLQIYVAFFGLPLAGIQIPNFILGVTVMCMNSGAYMCEIFRAGILSINKGQTEAARSLGMNGADVPHRDPQPHERVHRALQGHVAARRRGHHGARHVCAHHRCLHRLDHALHRGSPVLPGDHAAPLQGDASPGGPRPRTSQPQACR